jgi:methylenetetrahydrofolate reductase (NADPH)
MHGRGRPVFSFEFFPPKTDAAADELMRTVAELEEKLAPDFVSVTYGAGGSTRERTLECVTRIQNELGITAMAHLTCVGHSKDELHGVVRNLEQSGIENVLALRGDPPKEAASFQPHPQGFAHANELAAFLTSTTSMDIGGACYPEGHPESRSAAEGLRWTLAKEQAGARFLITQLFFDNRDYFDFVANARAAGVTVPITPGIMPVTNLAQIERFTQMCGARIPAELKARLERVRDDPARVMATGLEHAIEQCQELLELGAPGLHFYTLNKSAATRTILAGVRRRL